MRPGRTVDAAARLGLPRRALMAAGAVGLL